MDPCSKVPPGGLQYENCSPNDEQSSYEQSWETKEWLLVQSARKNQRNKYRKKNWRRKKYDKRMWRVKV